MSIVEKIAIIWLVLIVLLIWLGRPARELLGFTPLAVGFIHQLRDFFQKFQLHF
jgi:uncharacterized membrane protein